MEIYLVQGCGISVVCHKAAVSGWMTEIINKGGVPTVQLWARGGNLQ